VLQTLCRARPPRGGHGVRPLGACVRAGPCVRRARVCVVIAQRRRQGTTD